MKALAVILLYSLFFTGDRGKVNLWILAPLLILGLALTTGLEVPTMNELTEMLKGGVG